MFFLRRSTPCQRTLRRIMRCLASTGLRDGSGEVVVVHPEIVLARNSDGGPEPLANHVTQKQFRLTVRAQVVEPARPRLKAGAADDPDQLGPHIRSGAAGPRDHKLGLMVCIVCERDRRCRLTRSCMNTFCVACLCARVPCSGASREHVFVHHRPQACPKDMSAQSRGHGTPINVYSQPNMISQNAPIAFSRSATGETPQGRSRRSLRHSREG